VNVPTIEERTSYVLASREVNPTMDLRLFLARVTDIGVEVLGYGATTLAPEHASISEQLEPDYEPSRRGVGIPVIDTSKASELWLTLFEVRRPKGPHDSAYLKRLYNRLERLKLPQASSDGPMRVTSNVITESTLPIRSGHEREYGLEIAEGPGLDQIVAEHEAIYAAARQPAGRKQAEPIDPLTIRNPGIVPIFKLPGKIDAGLTEEFVTELNHRLFFGTYVHLEIDEPEWTQRLR
jgi:hypothetical protein